MTINHNIHLEHTIKCNKFSLSKGDAFHNLFSFEVRRTLLDESSHALLAVLLKKNQLEFNCK